MNGHGRVDAAATCEPGPSHLNTNGLSPTNGTNGTSGSAKSTPNDDPPPVTLARPFRSRKNRPCDGCRRAKTRCAIVAVGTPCVECQHTRKKCTFDELPRQRKKPAAASSSTDGNPSFSNDNTKKRSLSPNRASSSRQQSYGDAYHEEITIDSTSSKKARFDSEGSESPGAYSEGKDSGVSLEETLGYHMITSVLTDDLLPVGARRAGSQGDEHTRQISLDSTKPQYVIFSYRIENESARTRLSSSSILAPIHTVLSLKLSFKKVTPRFRFFLHRQELLDIRRRCLPKVYVSALNHLPGGVNGIHRSSLAAVSDALLDVSARPVGDAEELYLILAKAIAQAQLIGLHLDPTEWGIPEWEKDWRRVLWWGLRVHDGWMSFLNSRPSHIQANNHDVSVPSLAAIRRCTEGDGLAFHLLCRLAVVVARLQREICTVMARREEREERVARVVEIEADVEELVAEVRTHVNKGKEVPGFASFITSLLGLRCMIRRIAIELAIGLGAPFTPDPDTLTRYAQAVDYIASLNKKGEEGIFDGWWLVHVGHVLSSVMSSLIRLSLATMASEGEDAPTPSFGGGDGEAKKLLPVPPSLNPIFLLARLRVALQEARDKWHWDLADAALARADNVARVEIEGGGYGLVVKALKGEWASPKLVNVQAGGKCNIDLSTLGTHLDWTGFQGFEGMQHVGDAYGQGWSPDYGVVSS
ncbi:hypothetical protein BDZ89DRAFT_1079915 [Hymenopellis radicata]|nr:hypothetical protein BDZ89DRAFT_1079915 [Hymenopellis radicata]